MDVDVDVSMVGGEERGGLLPWNENKGISFHFVSQS